jgi:transposase
LRQWLRRQGGTDAFVAYLRERLTAYPALTATRLWRELRERGVTGGYTAVKRAIQEIRPDQPQRFEVAFIDEPGITRVVWLFSMALGFSRLIWAQFIVHQDLQTVLRCHVAAFNAIGGAPREDPVRPDEDRGDRRGCRRTGRLQPRSDRYGAAFWLPSEGVSP